MENKKDNIRSFEEFKREKAVKIRRENSHLLGLPDNASLEEWKKKFNEDLLDLFRDYLNLSKKASEEEILEAVKNNLESLRDKSKQAK